MKNTILPETNNRTEYMRAYMKLYRANKKELGLCLDCMSPAVSTNYCERHQQYYTKYALAYRDEVRIAKSAI